MHVKALVAEGHPQDVTLPVPVATVMPRYVSMSCKSSRVSLLHSSFVDNNLIFTCVTAPVPLHLHLSEVDN